MIMSTGTERMKYCRQESDSVLRLWLQAGKQMEMRKSDGNPAINTWKTSKMTTHRENAMLTFTKKQNKSWDDYRAPE